MAVALAGPSSMISWAYTVLTEWTVASIRLILPEASFSALLTCQISCDGGGLGHRLSVEVDRRGDPQPAPEEEVPPRLGRVTELPRVQGVVEDETLHLFDEVRSGVTGVGAAVAKPERPGRGGVGIGSADRA